MALSKKPRSLLHPTMHSWINLFLFYPLLVLFFNPKNMRLLLLSSSSETKLFELDSLPRSYLTFLGDSSLQDKAIALTNEDIPTNAPRSVGMVFYRHPVSFLDPRSKKVRSFHTMFAFSIQNVYGDRKAFGDGLAFLISADDHLLGSPGYLGLVDSAHVTRNKFIAIEFDTKCDSMFRDPDDNHVGLDINNLFSIKLASSLVLDLKSGIIIVAWIDYKSDEKRLEVYLSNSYLKPKKPLLKVDIDLSAYLKEKMFVGFSGATEGSVQFTHIEKWEFTAVDFSPPPPPASPPVSGRTSESGHKQSHLSSFGIVLIVGVCSVPCIALFGWFSLKKLIEMIQNSEITNSQEMQTIESSRGISCQKIHLSILVDEVANGLNIEKVLNNVAELIRVKTVEPSIPTNILPVYNGRTLRTNDETSI